jgi:DNA-binding NarL/FixJ family response regulator
MTKPNIQIDDLVREMTNEEYQTYLADQSSQELYQAEQEAKATARQSALAKLAALGLTEEEIGAL